MTVSGWRPYKAIAILLVVAAGLFVLGVSIERGDGDHHEEPAGETTEHDETNESAEHRASEGEAAQPAGSEEGENEERALGLDVESPLLVAAAVAVSLLLAGLVWRRPRRQLLLVAVGFSAAFTVLDVAEVVHQLEEDKTGLALLAAVIALLHAAIAALAIQQVSRRAAGSEPAAP